MSRRHPFSRTSFNPRTIPLLHIAPDCFCARHRGPGRAHVRTNHAARRHPKRRVRRLNIVQRFNMPVKENHIHPVRARCLECAERPMAIRPNPQILRRHVRRVPWNRRSIRAVAPSTKRAIVRIRSVVPIRRSRRRRDHILRRLLHVPPANRFRFDGPCPIRRKYFRRRRPNLRDPRPIIRRQCDDSPSPRRIRRDNKISIQPRLIRLAERLPGLIQKCQGSAVAQSLPRPNISTASAARRDRHRLIYRAGQPVQFSISPIANPVIIPIDRRIFNPHLPRKRPCPIIRFIKPRRISNRISRRCRRRYRRRLRKIPEHRPRCPPRPRQPPLVFRRIHYHRLPDGVQVAHANRHLRRPARLCHCWQEHPND